jgi:hypothetical protein
MQPKQANLINAIVVLAFGLLRGVSPLESSFQIDAYIPIGGILLLLLHPFFIRKDTIAVFSVLGITVLLLLMIVRPMISAIQSNDIMDSIRLASMLLSGIAAFVVYYKNLYRLI